jgi:hypothetical protein
MVWNTETGNRLLERAGKSHRPLILLDAHKRGILTGLLSECGKIITSGGDNAVKIWTPLNPID